MGESRFEATKTVENCPIGESPSALNGVCCIATSANGLSSTHHAKRTCGWRAKVAKDEIEKGLVPQQFCSAGDLLPFWHWRFKHIKTELKCQCCVQVRQISDLTDLDEPEVSLGTLKVMVYVLDVRMQSKCINPRGSSRTSNRFGPRRANLELFILLMQVPRSTVLD